MWRPKGWKNLYRDFFGKLNHQMNIKEAYETGQHYSFEAGADAMLMALRERAVSPGCVDPKPGVFVFIPDEEDLIDG